MPASDYEKHITERYDKLEKGYTFFKNWFFFLLVAIIVGFTFQLTKECTTRYIKERTPFSTPNMY